MSKSLIEIEVFCGGDNGELPVLRTFSINSKCDRILVDPAAVHGAYVWGFVGDTPVESTPGEVRDGIVLG